MANNVTLNPVLRKRVGEVLSDYIEAGRRQLGDAPDWWGKVRDVHMGDGATAMRALKGEYGSPKVHMPLSQPRQDALVDQTCSVVLKQDPYMLNVSDEDETADAKQQILQRVWEDADFGAAFKSAVDIATDTDIAFLRCCPLGESQIELSVHEPIDVVVWPALPSGWSDVTIAGHRVWKRRRDVQIGKDEGRYYRDDRDDRGQDVPGESPSQEEDRHSSYDRSGVSPSTGPLAADELVELWDVVVWLDLSQLKKEGEEFVTQDARWYRATVSKDGRQVLALEPYELSTPWYFTVRLLSNSEFYPARSIGRNLFPIQQTYDYLWTAAYEGAMTAAKPPIIGPSLADESYTTWSFGDYLKLDGGGGQAPWSPPIKADLSGLFPLIQECKNEADKVANISNNTTGGVSDDRTATEAGIIAAGVAVGIEARIENATHDLPRMARLTLEIVGGNPTGFGERFNIVPPPPSAPAMPDLGALVAA